ncbi:AMP-binding protein [Aromatoleum toluclasticum]|uniref:AMP-binding protein n=1 Tax=Aromatoleum toluclasticum TaxID=92003 RepID=UPI001D180F6C|nr:AMP-binding protein [Aromatoleum toluclasticum]MCC4115863.1 AMP-binding protein [Aromatoleum toluclasticum]
MNRSRPAIDAAEVLGIVRGLVGELRPGKPPEAGLDSHLERELGLDSLARVELLARIERAAHARLPEDTLASAETPRQLFAALCAARPDATSSAPGLAAAPDTTRIEAPSGAATLVDVLLWHAERSPDHVHIRLLHDDAEVGTLTHRELLQGAQRIAAGLRRRGLTQGEAVAIMLPTSLEFFTSFFGALLAGGVPVPMYPPTRPSQLEDHLRRQSGILESCRAPVLITDEQVQPVARLISTPSGSLRHTVTAHELAAGAGSPAAATPRPDELALLQYTSGSTGNPKGVMLTHANLLANIRAWSRSVAITAADVTVSWLPLYHDMGLIAAWLGSLYNGCPLVLMSPLDFLSRPVRWLRALHRYRGTLSAAPNFAYELVLKHVEESELAGLDLSHWRIAANGAEPVNPDTLEHFAARLAPYGLHRETMTPAYGLAENAVGLTVPPPGRGPRIDRVVREAFFRTEAIRAAAQDASAIRFVGCGQPLPGHDLRIVGADGDELRERRIGRIEFRGPSATAGYLRNPAETRKLLRAGWLDTGDLGYLAEGELFVTGRVKDMIIRGGRNLYPYELEDAIGALPGVRRGCVAVFGVANPATASERLVAVVETRSADEAERHGLEHAVGNLAVDLLGVPLDEVVLAPPHSVLKTSSGKIRRAATRELYETGVLGRQHSVRMQMLHLAATAATRKAAQGLRRALGTLWAAWAWTALVLLAVPVWISVATLRRPALGWRIGRTGARLLAALVGIRIDVRGLENLPASAPCIVVANHASYLDGLIAAAALPRPFVFVAKRELLDNTIARRFLQGLGTEFIERFAVQDSADAAKRLAERARLGAALFYFPEGTFVRRPGLQEFRLGAFLAASEAELPVVPVTIRGTRAVLPDETWRPRRGPVRVTIGRPILPRGKDWNAALALRDAARRDILAHCGEPDAMA